MKAIFHGNLRSGEVVGYTRTLPMGVFMKPMLALSLAAAAALGSAGCVVRAHGHGHTAVVISAGHFHSDHCGHYYWRGGWYIMNSHRHSVGCGHLYRSGIWIYDDGG